MATAEALKSLDSTSDKRPFVMSRSTFASTGRYAFHWIGNNHRTFEDMKHSISGVMNFNMFGIPMTGPDVCGFYNDSPANSDES